MSDGESPKKPPAAPLAPPLVRAFPPVPRPGSPAAPYSVAVHEAAPASPPPKPEETEEDDPPSLEALVAPRTTQVSEPLALEALGRAARLVPNLITTAETSDPAVEYDSAPSNLAQLAAPSTTRPIVDIDVERPPAPSRASVSSAGPSVAFDPVPVTDPFAEAPPITIEDASRRGPVLAFDPAPFADVPASPEGIPAEALDEAPITRPSLPNPELHAVPLSPVTMASKDGAPAPENAAVTTRLVASLIIAASLVMVLWHMQLSSRENANTGSRYATIESLVDYGTYNIDASRYLFTPDKVKARGHYVSSKPPLLPTYGAGVYYLLKKLTGYSITDNESIVVWTVGVFTGWLGHLVFLIYFYKLCKLLLVRQLAILVTVAAASFAYLGVAYATAINNHSVGAAFAVAGFYHAFKAKHELGGKLDWVLAGLALGVLPAIDLSSL
ncbi:MAG TPA: hypothetical protein VHU80_08770, partial [Polyangiaceae bacterium]|nr:hypothetical protein [Polyangiaceae bacterium]